MWSLYWINCTLLDTVNKLLIKNSLVDGSNCILLNLAFISRAKEAIQSVMVGNKAVYKDAERKHTYVTPENCLDLSFIFCAL